MKLTLRLQRNNYNWLLDQMWKYGRSRRKGGHLNVPIIHQKRGTPIASAEEILDIDKPKFAKWQPEVLDDPRVKAPWKPQDHPDYHEQTMYQFDNHTRLQEGLTQAGILTKSQIFHHPPPSISNLLNVLNSPNQDEYMIRSIMRAHKFEPTKEKLLKRKNPDLPIWNFKAEFGIPKLKVAGLLLDGLIHLLNTHTPHYIDLLDRSFISDVIVSSYFAFNDTTDIWIKGKSHTTLFSPKPLVPFASDEVIDESVSYVIPSIYPMSPTIDLKHKHIWRLENSTGLKDSAMHVHTIFLTQDDEWSESQRDARSLLFCFSQAVAMAKQQFGNEVTDLPFPISTQCISTDGEFLTFVCFQLNTLNFSSAVKNLAWVDSHKRLFCKVLPKRGMLRHTQYLDYDPSVLTTAIAMFANGVDVNKSLNLFESNVKSAN